MKFFGPLTFVVIRLHCIKFNLALDMSFMILSQLKTCIEEYLFNRQRYCESTVESA